MCSSALEVPWGSCAVAEHTKCSTLIRHRSVSVVIYPVRHLGWIWVDGVTGLECCAQVQAKAHELSRDSDVEQVVRTNICDGSTLTLYGTPGLSPSLFQIRRPWEVGRSCDPGLRYIARVLGYDGSKTSARFSDNYIGINYHQKTCLYLFGLFSGGTGGIFPCLLWPPGG